MCNVQLFICAAGIVCGLYVILLGIFKIRRETFKWYSLNILVAYCITMCCKIAVLLQLGSPRAMARLLAFASSWSFSLVRFTMLCSLLEIYCIYSFRNSRLSRLYDRVWPPRLIVHIAGLSLSVFVVGAFYFQPILHVAVTTYCLTTIIVYLISVVILCIVICTIYYYRKGKHKPLTKHLWLPLFFFLPVTLIDLPTATTAGCLILENYGVTIPDTVYFIGTYSRLVNSVNFQCTSKDLKQISGQNTTGSNLHDYSSAIVS
ncbi:unnamed protein product [Gongylonema pulchrum]|uniref:G_PROTEIN_RECEP_F1_2 domain-containing protein n=1 Tax=Gongylonema pulchrum TaxID=637853 RepID=A0A183E0F4_9BILA|nr:unnamed protein product [Gongylonema pulchrum]